MDWNEPIFYYFSLSLIHRLCFFFFFFGGIFELFLSCSLWELFKFIFVYIDNVRRKCFPRTTIYSFSSLFTFCREIALEELGIRDMNLTEQTEEALEDEKAAINETPKTWSTAEVCRFSNSSFRIFFFFFKFDRKA